MKYESVRNNTIMQTHSLNEQKCHEVTALSSHMFSLSDIALNTPSGQTKRITNIHCECIIALNTQ